LPKVVIVEGPGTGTEFELEDAAILGRLDSNDIPVQDRKASREHAKIYKQGRQFAIVDLNSSNGTYVNDEQITKRMLKTGDEIGIGTVRLRFEDPEGEAARKEALVRRPTLDEDFANRAATESPRKDGVSEIVLKGHQPLQFSRVRAGKPLLGFDLDQLSDTGRMVVWIVLLAFFAGLIYLSYALVVG
jgi:pSer/pThr/pTyr-binding forkhead associated (FHA) protein